MCNAMCCRNIVESIASKQAASPSFLPLLFLFLLLLISSRCFLCCVVRIRERERCACLRLRRRRCRRFASPVVFRWTNYGWSATWLLYCAGRRESLSKNEMKWRRLPAAYTMALKGDNRRRFVLDLSGSICSCSNKKLIFDPTCNANIMHALVHIVRS